ncbi:hypothetical protein NF868_04590 [Bacillus zhangzhouensis]|nr:hypothetical protein NF868_04590 [Bacillus zhangzhouensis]
MSQWKGLDYRLSNLGFMVGVPSKVYVRQISREWFLIVEAESIKGYSEYCYSFYKTKFMNNGRMTSTKVFLDKSSVRQVYNRVLNYINYLERKQNIDVKKVQKMV